MFCWGRANTWGQPNHSSRCISLFPLQLLQSGLFFRSHNLEKPFLGEIPARDIAAGDANSAGFPCGGNSSPRHGLAGFAPKGEGIALELGCCHPHWQHPPLSTHGSGFDAKVSVPPLPSPILALLWQPASQELPTESRTGMFSLLLSHSPPLTHL